MIDFFTIQELMSRLPGAVESTSYGTPCFKANKKLLVRMHQSEDAFVVSLRSIDEQQALIASTPEHVYVTDHYMDYAMVLVRPSIDEEALFELLEKKWRTVALKSDIDAYDTRD